MNKNKLTEDQLVLGCRRGDRSAQSELFNRYSKAMYNVALRMMGSQAEAEDALQESFIDVFNKMDSFRSESTIGAWIKRIVINNCINKLRKKKIEIQELDEERHDGVQLVDRDVYKDKRVDLIKEAINVLPEGFKMVTNLYLFEGYDHAEIAQILGISESTSKSQYHRAKAKIRSKLETLKDQYN